VIQVTLRPPGELTRVEQDDVWGLLKEVDREFVPPLSSRNSTTSANLLPAAPAAPGPQSYFEEVLGQLILLASANGEPVGFMSCIPAHHHALVVNQSPCTYRSTLAVTASARRLGVARHLYGALLSLPDRYASPWVATRTWSTNFGHRDLLASLGFQEVVNLPDDRGPGIDTVYYARKRCP